MEKERGGEREKERERGGERERETETERQRERDRERCTNMPACAHSLLIYAQHTHISTLHTRKHTTINKRTLTYAHTHTHARARALTPIHTYLRDLTRESTNVKRTLQPHASDVAGCKWREKL